jgi:hypothetical protein
MADQKYDSLDGWREEVGIKTSKGEVKHYAGGSEYDPTAEAIRAYIEEEARKAKAAEQAKKDQGIER